MKGMPTREMCIGYDITDPTPYEEWSDEEEDEEEPREILGGKLCLVCHKPMMSDEYVTCGSRPDDWSRRNEIFLHSHCLTDEMQEILENLAGYSFVEDLGEAME